MGYLLLPQAACGPWLVIGAAYNHVNSIATRKVEQAINQMETLARRSLGFSSGMKKWPGMSFRGAEGDESLS
jgi:hypothetical protein